MKTSKNRDYDIWKDDDGYYCIRVRRTGEVVPRAPEDLVRTIWLFDYYMSQELEDDTITDEDGTKHRRIYSLDEERDFKERLRDTHFVYAHNPYEQLETEMMERDFLKTLTEKQRRVYYLRFVLELTISECAKRIGTNKANVNKHISKIKEKGKIFLKER